MWEVGGRGEEGRGGGRCRGGCGNCCPRCQGQMNRGKSRVEGGSLEVASSARCIPCCMFVESCEGSRIATEDVGFASMGATSVQTRLNSTLPPTLPPRNIEKQKEIRAHGSRTQVWRHPPDFACGGAQASCNLQGVLVHGILHDGCPVDALGNLDGVHGDRPGGGGGGQGAWGPREKVGDITAGGWWWGAMPCRAALSHAI